MFSTFVLFDSSNFAIPLFVVKLVATKLEIPVAFAVAPFETINVSPVERSKIESRKICKKKIVASEIMRKFYEAIHSKMYKKKIYFEKKIKLNSFEKIFILFFFFVRY